MRVEKLVALYTLTRSRDQRAAGERDQERDPVSHVRRGARRTRRAPGTSSGRSATSALPSEERVQFLLRFHISHVLQVCSRLTAHHDAGVPARGLNGEAYRGHVFWDELFVYPFLNFRLPEITRGLLMYRYRRIARRARRRGTIGYRGGDVSLAERQRRARRRPSASTSTRSRGAGSRTSAATSATSTRRSSTTSGATTTRPTTSTSCATTAPRCCWRSRASGPRSRTTTRERDRWEIHGVMGPDEFHEKHPGATEGGLRNNAYTNVMAAWICETAQTVLDLLPASRRDALRAKIGLGDEEMRRWERDEPQDVRALPRRRRHQPVRGLRGPRGARLGRLPRALRQHPAARPDPAGGGRRPQPLQDRQAGRRGDAVLPVLRRRAAAALRPARLRVRARHRAQDDRVLRAGAPRTARR